MVVPSLDEEMKGVDLGDKRLDKRAKQVMAALAAHPTASIPAACGGYKETAAAYRLFANEKAEFAKLIQPHLDATGVRIGAQKVALLANDTTELDLTRPDQQVRGAGPLDGGSRLGLFLHELHAFMPNGTPLGTVHAMPWARDEDKLPISALTRRQRQATPFEEKESSRWVLSLQKASEVARLHPETQVVYLADSEADIYELLVEATQQAGGADWIVRSCQNRALADDVEGRESLDYLREELLQSPVLFQKTIDVRGRKAKVTCDDRSRRQPRESREAVLEVRAARVTLRAPEREAGQLPDVTVNAVILTEVNPPEGDVPVEWILLTSLPIDTGEEVDLIVQYYCIRWMIEVFFRVLKVGCRVEERLFESIDHLLPCLALYLIAAWRVLFLSRIGRECPDVSCEVVLDPAEWQSVYQYVRREPPPETPPKLQDMIRMVAQLGGYVNRKRADEPGVQTLWLGMQRMHDITNCWLTFGPGARGAERSAAQPPAGPPDQEAELV
jgi:hypothetical protein